MKAGKIILGLFIAVIAIVVVVVFLGLGNLNQLVKQAVETVGPQVTKTSVSLREVNLELLEGRGQLSGLTIGNPPGFSSDYAFHMDDVVLQIDPQSLTQPVYVIKEVVIDGAKLIAEQKDLTNSNLQTLLKNVQGGAGSADKAPTNTESTSEAEPAGDVRLMVEKFRFVNSSIRIITEQWGERTLAMPDVKLNNIGDKQKGLTPEELTQALLKPVIAQAKRGVKKDLEAKLKEEAESKLKEKLSEKLSDEDKAKVDKLKSLFGK